ncbi:Alpha/Beta hydrolase protein [Syncephalastrum racemosum]|uniref:Carboxypeptidase n=1 Tax=Syncephalastrum racemosum TaxID=13706 RepID=A0A1X2HIU2_SYNRA|nr:Alpha/Beta hydrolase protein [Syncephalastrum racemosum]
MRFSVKRFLTILSCYSLAVRAGAQEEAMQQHVFSEPGRILPQMEDGLQEFRLLTSDKVKGYAARIKQPVSCEQGLQYSGYFDNLETDDHYFFYFFESRSNPAQDPVMLWLNGGPACSSTLGLWMELGPCLVKEDGASTRFNPYSWNTEANLLFLEQPVNVGYSYGNTTVVSSKAAGENVYAFFQLFFSEFTQFADNPFHISGESYAGHYLPAIASEIIRNNADRKLKAQGNIHLNLESVMIGNGWTDPAYHFKSYADFGCAHDSRCNDEQCKFMEAEASHCQTLLKECDRFPSTTTCMAATKECVRTQVEPFWELGLNPYDIRLQCGGDDIDCYPLSQATVQYANRPEVRAALGVSENLPAFQQCNDDLHDRFVSNGDFAVSTVYGIQEALDAGVRVLIYVGDQANWYGNKAWLLDMTWAGQEGFNDALDKPWLTKDKYTFAGEARTYSNLTFLRIYGAGHMVPYDQPENSLDMVLRWLKKEPLA